IVLGHAPVMHPLIVALLQPTIRVRYSYPVIYVCHGVDRGRGRIPIGRAPTGSAGGKQNESSDSDSFEITEHEKIPSVLRRWYPGRSGRGNLQRAGAVRFA